MLWKIPIQDYSLISFEIKLWFMIRLLSPLVIKLNHVLGNCQRSIDDNDNNTQYLAFYFSTAFMLQLGPIRSYDSSVRAKVRRIRQRIVAIGYNLLALIKISALAG